MELINTNIAKHPINWLVLWSMALVLAFFIHLVVSYFANKHPGNVGVPGNSAGPGTAPASSVTGMPSS